MIEQIRVPLRAERLQRETLVAPIEKELTQVIYLNARLSNYALPKYERAARDGAAEYLWLPSNRAPSPRYGKGTDSSATDPLNTSVRYNVNSVIAELEKRKAKLFAQARAAETRAREAEEKFEQFKSRLKQETNQRLGAEQRHRDIEEDRPRQLQAAEIERMKPTEAAMAPEVAEARLKQAERRIKEAEKDVTTLTLALTKAYQKKAEAEATARAVEEKAKIIQALFLRSETTTRIAIEGNLIFGLLVFASKSKITAMERAIRNVDARHGTQGDYLKNLLQKQTAGLPSIPEKATLAEGEFTSLNMLKSGDEDQACTVIQEIGFGTKLKFMVYGMIIMLLVGGCWNIIKGFH